MNITKAQAANLVKEWGAGFWRIVPASITDLAKTLGKPVNSVRWYIDRGSIPAPSLKWNRATHYLPDEVRRIVMFFNRPPEKRQRVGVRHVSQEEVAEMRRLWLAGERQPAIAELFGVSQGTVSRLIRGDR